MALVASAVIYAGLVHVPWQSDLRLFWPQPDNAQTAYLQAYRTGADHPNRLYLAFEGGSPTARWQAARRAHAFLASRSDVAFVASGPAELDPANLAPLYDRRSLLADTDARDPERIMRTLTDPATRRLEAAIVGDDRALADLLGLFAGWLDRQLALSETGRVSAEGVWRDPQGERTLLVVERQAGALTVRSAWLTDVRAGLDEIAADVGVAVRLAGYAVLHDEITRDAHRRAWLGVMGTIVVVVLGALAMLRSWAKGARIAGVVAFSSLSAAGLVMLPLGEVNLFVLAAAAPWSLVLSGFSAILIDWLRAAPGSPHAARSMVRALAWLISLATPCAVLAAQLLAVPVTRDVIALCLLALCCTVLVEAMMGPATARKVPEAHAHARLPADAEGLRAASAALCLLAVAVACCPLQGGSASGSLAARSERADLATLRSDLGQTMTGPRLVLFDGNLDRLLVRLEKLDAALALEQSMAGLASYHMPAWRPPSLSLQRARLVALPEREVLYRSLFTACGRLNAEKRDVGRCGIRYFADFINETPRARALGALAPSELMLWMPSPALMPLANRIDRVDGTWRARVDLVGVAAGGLARLVDRLEPGVAQGLMAIDPASLETAAREADRRQAWVTPLVLAAFGLGGALLSLSLWPLLPAAVCAAFAVAAQGMAFPTSAPGMVFVGLGASLALTAVGHARLRLPAHAGIAPRSIMRLALVSLVGLGAAQSVTMFLSMSAGSAAPPTVELMAPVVVMVAALAALGGPAGSPPGLQLSARIAWPRPSRLSGYMRALIRRCRIPIEV
ncbi:MAG: hypothetical protein ACFB3T_06200 [Geminicoccaceae bacterium]